MVAHVAELARFVVGSIVGVVDSLGGPHTDVTVSSSSCEAFAVRGDVAAVDLEVLLLAAMAQPCWLDDAHCAWADGGAIDGLLRMLRRGR